MVLLKLYGKILGYLLAGVLAVSTTIISSRALSTLNQKDQRLRSLEEKVDCLEKSQLTAKDIRSELRSFKLELIEEGMIIVPSRGKRANRDE